MSVKSICNTSVLREGSSKTLYKISFKFMKEFTSILKPLLIPDTRNPTKGDNKVANAAKTIE